MTEGVEGEGERERERERGGGGRGRQTDRQAERQTVSNSVFFAKSTTAVISG